MRCFTVTGSGATTIVEYEMDHGWRSQWLLMHFGDSLQINDFGYLSRANLNYGHWQVSHRITDLPRESRYSSHDWRWRISATALSMSSPSFSASGSLRKVVRGLWLIWAW